MFNSCPDCYGKNRPLVQSVVYCFGCEGKRGGGGGWVLGGISFHKNGWPYKKVGRG